MAEYKVEALLDEQVTTSVVSDQLQVEVSIGPVGVDNGGQPTQVYLTQAEYDALPVKDGNVAYNIVPE